MKAFFENSPENQKGFLLFAYDEIKLALLKIAKRAFASKTYSVDFPFVFTDLASLVPISPRSGLSTWESRIQKEHSPGLQIQRRFPCVIFRTSQTRQQISVSLQLLFEYSLKQINVIYILFILKEIMTSVKVGLYVVYPSSPS